MTEKLYDYDSYTSKFDAVVLSCDKTESGYKIILDKTAFFPTEGGQMCDTGTLDDIEVTNVTLEDETVCHFVDTPIKVGETVRAVIDFEERYRKMQNHTGEHIICSIAHKLYGCENVGFHLGDDYVTMDLDKPLNDEQLSGIEILANKAIYANVPVKAYYPTEEELKNTDFRSKDGITGRVRLVNIEGYDICACCAPHVARTGEVGIVKILDWINYKGGVRLNILCGLDALRDYHQRYKRNAGISALLSVKQEDVVSGVSKLIDDIADLRNQLGEKSKEITRLRLEGIKETVENICLFIEEMSNGEMRHLANGAKSKTSKIAALFCGDDTKGYNYIIASDTVDLKPLTQQINTALDGRGGGNSAMIQGSIKASKDKIKSYILNL